MAVTISFGSGVTQEAYRNYATGAGKVLYVNSGTFSPAKSNFKWKVEVLNSVGGNELTAYIPPTSVYSPTSGVFIYLLTFNFGAFIHDYINDEKRLAGTYDRVVRAITGILEHKFKVTEVYDNSSGVPTEGDSATTPTSGTWIAHKAKEINISPSAGFSLRSVANVTETLERSGNRTVLVTLDESTFGGYVRVLVSRQTGSTNSIKALEDVNGNPIIGVGSHRTLAIPVNETAFGSFDNMVTAKIHIQKFTAEIPDNNDIQDKDEAAGGNLILSLDDDITVDIEIGDYLTIESADGLSVYNDKTYEVIDIIDNIGLKSVTLDVGYVQEPYDYIITYVFKAQETNVLIKTYVLTGRCAETVTFRNRLGGFDALDMVPASETETSTGSIINTYVEKKRFGVTGAKRKELGGVNAYGKQDLAVELVKSAEHWVNDDKVVLITDAVNVYNVREMTEINIEVEYEDY